MNLLSFANSSSSLSGNLKLNTDGTIGLFNGATQVGSYSSALNTSTWYCLELRTKRISNGNDIVEGRIDTVSFASSSSLTLGVTTIDKVIIGDSGTNFSTDIRIDDWAINDSSGSFQNSWPGDGEIIHLRPNADGDTTTWFGADFTDVDEVTPDDATTSIADNDAEDTYEANLDATPVALASDDTINVVQVGVRFREASAVAVDPIVVLRIKASSGGTVEESSNITLDSATWSTNAMAAPRNYALTLYDLPGASTTAWTKADLDTAQIGVRLTNNADADAEVSTLWLLVDHTPAVAGGNDLSDVILRNESLRLLRVGK